MNHPAPAHQSDRARTTSHRTGGDTVGILAGDIHDIRMLTATGPIELPAAPDGEPGRRGA